MLKRWNCVISLFSLGATCADLFPHNYTSFGSKAKCRFKSKFLAITLLGGPTIRLGELMVNTSFIESSAKKTVYGNDLMKSVSITAPPGLKAPKIRVSGPRTLGKFLFSEYH